jgi:hypothetical protein
MSGDEQAERQVRAARNQSMFRMVNERLTELNEAFQSIDGGYVIACECADVGCTEMLTITADAYEAIRREPNRFAVLPDHVYPDVETVVDEHPGYVVVAKHGAAEPIVRALDPRA